MFAALVRKILTKLCTPRELGARGEQLAAAFLQSRGFRIIARSSRDRLGEIDLVALDGRTVVFVEVKTRRSHARGHPADAVDTVKQRRLSRLALAWLKGRGLLEVATRFDVVAITWPVDNETVAIDYYRNAFESSGPTSLFG